MLLIILLVFNLLIVFYVKNSRFIKFYMLSFAMFIFFYCTSLIKIFLYNQYYYNIVNLHLFFYCFELFHINIFFEFYNYSYIINFSNLVFKLSLFFFINLYKFDKYIYIIDGLSLVLIFLTCFLFFICVNSIWYVSFNFKLLNILIILIILLVILSFMTTNILLFYVFFESILIPMFILIGIWGSRERKLDAAYKFFIYTAFGSIFFLIVIIYLYSLYGTLELYELLELIKISKFYQKLCWFLMFITFATKIPLFPFHTRLPEAHAEAPTVGSILLAGILLKLGPYGLLRFLNLLFPYGLIYYRNIVFLLSLCSIYYTILTAIRQIDLKKIIAYSSIGHMAFIILSILSNSLEGIIGGIVLLIAHGYVSGGLFFLVGSIYDRYKTRIIIYYGGLAQNNPKLACFMFLFILANIAFPGTMNFLAELFILISLQEFNLLVFFFSAFSAIFVLIYNLLILMKIFFFKNQFSTYINYTPDLTIREISLCILFYYPIIYWGFFITSFITLIKQSCIIYLMLLIYVI